MLSCRRNSVAALAACLSLAGTHAATHAAPLITAEQVLANLPADAASAHARAGLLSFFDREDVALGLAAQGVDVAQARLRVAALTDAECMQLMHDIDHAPAGAGEIVGTVVLLGVLLVFSDILGFTRIFPFLRPAR